MTYQAILSKYIPATNTKGSRIKAYCERGSITIPYPYELSGAACHREAVYALLAKFRDEDGSKCSWCRPFVTGGLADGYAHVFM
jgi:hypothetical protein